MKKEWRGKEEGTSVEYKKMSLKRGRKRKETEKG